MIYSPVTPKFDIPATETAVQRATTLYQRRRKKLLSLPDQIPEPYIANHPKTMRSSKSLESSEICIEEEYDTGIINKTKGTY